MIRHDKTGIEADTELADDRITSTAVLRVVHIIHCIAEVLRARLRNRAKVLDDLISCHANAAIENSDSALLRVSGDANLEGLAACFHLAACNLEPKLFERIRTVREELTNENFLICVDRLGHDIKELASFCLKLFLGRSRENRLVLNDCLVGSYLLVLRLRREQTIVSLENRDGLNGPHTHS